MVIHVDRGAMKITQTQFGSYTVQKQLYRPGVNTLTTKKARCTPNFTPQFYQNTAKKNFSGILFVKYLHGKYYYTPNT
jgi:nucleoid DNA-binding protein